MNKSEEQFNRFHTLKFETEQAIRYHRSRAQFLYQYDRISKFLGVISGSTLLINALGSLSVPFLALTALATIFTLSMLVFRVAEKAGEHVEALKSMVELSNKISRLDQYNLSDSDLLELEEQKNLYLTKNLHEIDALSYVCYNEVARAFGLKKRIKIGWLQERLAQIGTFQREFDEFYVN